MNRRTPPHAGSPTGNPWDVRYRKDGYAYGTVPNDFLVSVVHRLPPGGRVLSLCEGEGRNAVFLAEQGFAVTAVDGSAVGIGKIRRLAAERGVTVAAVHADLAGFTIEPGGWDAIVSIFCHVPEPLRRALHRACVCGLVPGGVFVLEAYTPRQLELGTGGPPLAELMMTLATLRDELAGLEFIMARETEREVLEGRLHRGRGAVVQVLARMPLERPAAT